MMVDGSDVPCEGVGDVLVAGGLVGPPASFGVVAEFGDIASCASMMSRRLGSGM